MFYLASKAKNWSDILLFCDIKMRNRCIRVLTFSVILYPRFELAFLFFSTILLL